ncbi:SCP2 sterol-binding domain-containing protein [Undibacterium cyanobacteriorum]|uniref:SCP2 sterol-binding domain-containing protein n=1 Tax=Undibacterium cyanobacteriorum TaxID=3073561 RepID=A0ABY9RET9_9BURK|nr:SCP2 sterol-binding domain-containing protein [Undibacterium sp. 20NA77.5]WMW79170.1 SCP2 sterol-binding domain-containing protein [Undibacterium sp. 20NA77.5]
MDLQACAAKIREKLGQDSSLNAVLKFDCGSDGVIVVDAIVRPHLVDHVDRDADCTVSLSLSDLGKLLNGELNPVMGFMSGQLKLAGDMSIAMRLQKVV